MGLSLHIQLTLDAGAVASQGDLTEAFAWSDPVVNITVQRVE